MEKIIDLTVHLPGKNPPHPIVSRRTVHLLDVLNAAAFVAISLCTGVGLVALLCIIL